MSGETQLLDSIKDSERPVKVDWQFTNMDAFEIGFYVWWGRFTAALICCLLIGGVWYLILHH